MGKVTVIIESEQVPTALLCEAAQAIVPLEQEFRSKIMQISGVSPAEVKVFIVPEEEE